MGCRSRSFCEICATNNGVGRNDELDIGCAKMCTRACIVGGSMNNVSFGLVLVGVGFERFGDK